MRPQTLKNRLFHARVKGVLVGDLEDMTHRVAGFESEVQVLSRQPTRQELKVCLDYRRNITDRAEAFEDILWALLNHAEFMHRR